MAALMERPEIESREVHGRTHSGPQLWTVALLWVGATALYILGLVGTLFIVASGYSPGNGTGVFAAAIGALMGVAGAGGQYLVLRRGLRSAGRPLQLSPRRWTGGMLLASAGAAAVMAFTIFVWPIVELFIVGDSPGNMANHAALLVLANMVTGGVGGAIVGAVMGSIQWGMLESVLARCAWVRSSVLGWLLASVADLGLTSWLGVITDESLTAALPNRVVMAVVALIPAIVPGLFTARALMRGLAGGARPGAAQR